MDTTTLIIAAALALLVGLVLLAALIATRRAAAHRAALPDNTVALLTPATYLPSGEATGRILLLLIGTFSENVGENLLTMLANSGLAGVIGSVLLIELDQRRRERFLAAVPNIFAERIISVSSSGLSGGLSNADPDTVLSHIDRWGPAVLQGAADVCELHQRLQRGHEPALVLAFISQGGQALLGVTALEEIRRHFRVSAYGFSALPEDDVLRKRAERIITAYRAAGLSGIALADNRLDPLKNDLGMVATIAGFSASAEHADTAVELNNALYLLFSHAPDGIVGYSTHTHPLPSYPYPGAHNPPRYFTYTDALVSGITTALEVVRQPEHHSLGAKAALAGTHPSASRFDIVLAPIVPEHLKLDEDIIRAGQRLKHRDQPNSHLHFASICLPVDAARPQCPITVVSLWAPADGQSILRELTTPAQPAVAYQLDGATTGARS